jgi:hypothetical protein
MARSRRWWREPRRSPRRQQRGPGNAGGVSAFVDQSRPWSIEYRSPGADPCRSRHGGPRLELRGAPAAFHSVSLYPIQRESCRVGREGEGNGGEGSNRHKERAKHHCCSRSSATHRHSAPGRKKAFGDSACGTGGLGVTASCRARARNRPRLREPIFAYRRDDLAALRRNPGDARRLSHTHRDLAADAATRMASPMKATTRRSLLRVWRAMTWPLWSHLALALATGLACGVSASHYPDVVSPSYAALLRWAARPGTLPALHRVGFRYSG